MILSVDGQLAPSFQIEYPRWRFHFTGSKILPEKVADCNPACQPGGDKDHLNLIYTYVAGPDLTTQTRELTLSQAHRCKLLFKDGHVYLKYGQLSFWPSPGAEARRIATLQNPVPLPPLLLPGAEKRLTSPPR